MICVSFILGGLIGGGIIHWRWRRWNNNRRIKIDTSGDSYIESELAPKSKTGYTL